MPHTDALANARISRLGTLRLLRLAVIASLILPVALFSFASFVSYRDNSALQDERLGRTLDVLQEQATRVFRSIDATLDSLEAITGGRSDAELAGEAERLHERLKQIADSYPEIQSAWIFDRTGRAVATSLRNPPPPGDFSHRDYFRAHLEGGLTRYIGEVHESAFGGEPFFAVSRARYGPDKAFAGVVEVSIIPSDFYRFYSSLVSGGGIQYGLIRRDGTFLVRYPQPPSPTKRLTPISAFAQAIATAPTGGIYSAVSQIDGIERRLAYRLLPEFGIYVSTGIETATIRRQWLQTMSSHLLFGVPATLLLAISLVTILRRTQRLHSEQDRREAAEIVARHGQKMEAIGQLTGGVAHDFNNLLTIILGNLEQADRQLKVMAEGPPERLQRAISRAMAGAQRAATLTQRLLAFSRQVPHNPEPIDANRLLNGLSDFLGRSLGEKVSLEVVGAAGLWNCEVDRSELEAALINLCVNARDAMPDGGKLTIETSNAYLDDTYTLGQPDLAPGQYVMISITDTGIGMARETAERAFEPFFTTKPPGHGTGLGLSQVYGFVKQSRGHIKIYSELGQGTTVKIYLPRFTGDSKGRPDMPEAAVVKGQGEIVLVVEDDAEVRRYVVETLRDLDYRVVHASSAENALERSSDEALDLLLTDVVLPGMNGRQLAEEMTKRQPALRVIYMTGYSRNAIIHQGRLDPGIELLQKPLNSSELARKVHQVLSRQAS